MRPIEEIKKNHRLMIVREGWDGFMAYLVHPQYKPQTVGIVASWGGGWEHVSVSLPRRCPTWDEMCLIKDIFWDEEECVVQFHPPRSQYVQLERRVAELEKNMSAPDCQIRVDAESCVPEKLAQDIAEAIAKSTGKNVQVQPAQTRKTFSDTLREIFGAK